MMVPLGIKKARFHGQGQELAGIRHHNTLPIVTYTVVMTSEPKDTVATRDKELEDW